MLAFIRRRLVVVFRFCGLAAIAACALAAVVYDGTRAVVDAAGRADGSGMRKLALSYRGAGDVTDALRSGAAKPGALATIDLNSDAAPDVIAGYSWNGTGIVTVQYGNTDAFAPRDESVFARTQAGYNPDPLVGYADTYLVPQGVDLIEVGDFNHDNRKDVLTAKRGGDLYILKGDGSGRLGEPERIELPGTVTAMTAGEFRAADGWTDAVAAIDGASGPQLVVYDGFEGVAGEPLVFRLGGRATSVAIDALDDDPYRDIAAAAGGELDIIHGWGRKQIVDPEKRLQRVDLGYNSSDIATGFFVWNRGGNSDIALLSDDGTIHIMAPGGTDERPLTEAEAQTRSRSRGRLVKQNIDIESVGSWQTEKKAAWEVVRTVMTGSGATATSGKVFQRSHISFGVTDDIVMSDADGRGLVTVRQAGGADAKQSGANDLKTETIDADDAPAAFLALPQKLNGERDLITMHADGVLPIMIPQAPTAGITVNRFDDPNGAALAAASVCVGGGGDCSLRGAVQFANAHAGTTINIPAGTVVLATSGVGGNGGCTTPGESNVNGDLEINTTTTLIGAGQATTVIRQAAATNDRVFCLDVPLAGSTYNFSAMTITGGRDPGINGGAGLLGGAKNGTTNFTNLTFVNNQTSNASFGGGGATVTGGNMNVTNCTFGAGSLPGPAGTRNDLTVGNASFTSGGGLSYTSGDPLGTNGAVGTLTMTGTTFTHNTAAGIGGGGLDVFGLNVSTPTVNVSTTTFTSNQGVAAGTSGGGLVNEAGNVTLATTSFTSNSVLNRGGAIYVGGGSLTLDGTSPSLTFTSNSATSGGSSVGTASTVNMLGTNTTIGGSIQVESGGIWNNSTATLAPTDIVIAGGTFNCNASTMNVAGNLTLGPSGNSIFGGTFNGNSGTVNLAGNLTTSNVGTSPVPSFNGNTGTFNFNGASAQSITGTLAPTFNNLTVNKTGTLTLGVNSSVTGNLTLTAGTFDLGAFTVNRNAAGGSLTVSNGTTLKVGGTNPLPTNYSTHSIGATSTIEYSGSTQTVSTLNSSQNYGNLTSSGSGIKSLQGSTTVVGSLLISGGTLDVSASNFALNVAANFTNNVAAANFNPRAGTLTFNGSGTQNLDGSASSQAFNNFTVNKGGGTLTVGGSTTSLTMSGAVTLTAGTFAAGSATTIGMTTGNWTNNGGAFTPGSSVVSFTNTAAGQSINGTAATQTFNSITVAKTAQALSVGGSTTTLSLNGNLLLTSGTFTAPASLDINGGMTLNGGTLTAGANITEGGDWTNNSGTFTPGTGTVTFDGGGAQNLNGLAAAQTFNNFVVNKGGGTLTGGGTTAGLTINGSMTLTAGTFAAGSLTSIGMTTGNWTNNGGTFTPGSSVVSFTNTGGSQLINGSNTSQTFNSITMAKSATTLNFTGSTLSLNGTMLLTSGNLGIAGGNINVAGDWTNNGGAIIAGSGTVTFNGGGAQNLNGSAATQTFNNFTVSKGGGTLTGGGSTTTLTVGGNFGIAAGTFAAGTITTINDAGDWANGGTFTPGASNTVVFNGNNSTQTLTGTTSFTNLTLNHTGTGGVTAAGSSLTVTGLIRIQSGSFTSSSSYKDVQIDSGSTLASDGGTINVSGNWSNNGGTFTPSTGTVNFNGGSAQAIGGTASSQAFNNLIINKGGGALSTGGSTTSLTTNDFTLTAGTFTAPATLDINGNTVLTAGTFTAGGVTTAAGSWTRNGGTFTPGSGAVTFDGAALQTIGGSTGTTFNDLALNNAAGAALGVNTTVNGALTLTNGELGTGASTLFVGAAGTSTHTNGFVVGTMQKSFSAMGAFTYHLGTTGVYSPLDVSVTAGSGTLTAKANFAPVPMAPPLDPTKTLGRFWTVTSAGITSDNVFHYVQGSDVSGNEAVYQVIRVTGGTSATRYPNNANTFVTPGTDSFTVKGLGASSSNWLAGEPLAPTAADVGVSGRVLRADGQPVGKAIVRLTDDSGNAVTALTNSFGYYRFTNVTAGRSYVISVADKRFAFAPRIVTVSEELTDVDFVAEP